MALSNLPGSSIGDASMTGTVRTVAIIGGGTAGWMTAAALGKMLRSGPIEVLLVESDTIGTIGVGEATIPSLTDFNNFLGLDERVLIAETQATFKLGIRFDGWRKQGHSYLHPFGHIGTDLESVPFQHWWHRARKVWPDISLFSLETRAAEQGRFAHLTGIRHPLLDRTGYAYHLDAGRYAGILRQVAEGHGVKRIEGEISHVDLAEGSRHIRAVRLKDGREVVADLFVDCSGFSSLLLGQALGVAYTSWQHLLPCDRAWAIQCETRREHKPYTLSTASSWGWKWRIPLQHRVGNGHVFSSNHTSEQEALVELLSDIEGQASTEPRLLKFEAGRRNTFWEGNCVAIGLSAGFLEPLESTSIHLIQFAVQRLLGYFPRTDDCADLAVQFNRDISRRFEGIRDFLVLHYWKNQRIDEPFWQDCRKIEPPSGLAERIALYSNTGILAIADDELFRHASWLAVLEGQGVHARSHSALLDGYSDGDVAQQLSQLDLTIAKVVADMPPAWDYVRAVAEAGQKMSNFR